MIVYLSVLIGIMILGRLPIGEEHKKKKIFAISSFILLFIPSALRWKSVGADTPNYIMWFEYYGTHSFSKCFTGHFEPLYAMFNWGLYRINSSWRTIVIVNAFIIILSTVIFIYRYSKNVVMSTFVFITMAMYATSMNETRQFVALAVVLFGFKFIEERKFLKYLLLVFIASQIHTGAAIMIVLYFLYDIKFSRNSIFIIGITAVVGGYLYEEILNIISKFPIFTRYLKYLSDVQGSNGRTFLAMLLLLVFVVIFLPKTEKSSDGKLVIRFGRIKLYEKYEYNLTGMQNMLCWALCISIALYWLSTKYYYFVRFAEYFAFFNILLIPYIVEGRNNRNNRRIMQVTMYVVLTMYFLVLASATRLQGTLPFVFGE